MPSGAHNTGGMAITGMAVIGIGVGAADGSAGGIAAAASAAGVDDEGGYEASALALDARIVRIGPAALVSVSSPQCG